MKDNILYVKNSQAFLLDVFDNKKREFKHFVYIEETQMGLNEFNFTQGKQSHSVLSHPSLQAQPHADVEMIYNLRVHKQIYSAHQHL